MGYFLPGLRLVGMGINILYLIERMGPGGTEKQLAALIRGLDRNQFHPFLCTLRPSYSLFDDLVIPRRELHVKRLLHPTTAVTVKRLYQFCRRHRIHLIQTYFQDPTFIGALIKTGLRVKLVGSFRDLGFWRTPLENFKMRLAYPMFDGFIANSQSVKAHFCGMDRIAPQKVKVIYNGFKVRSRKTAEAAADHSDQLNVGIVGNFNRPVKRTQDFIKAAAIVAHAFPDARFTLVGGGSQESDLRQLADDLGISGQTRFVGMVDDALTYIETFDVGVNTSETEGFSNAIIEYMASAVPVVATAVGGNFELITDQANGYLYPVGDYHLAAARIIRLLHDRNLRLHMGAVNRTKIANAFTYEKMIENHQNFYRKTIGTMM